MAAQRLCAIRVRQIAHHVRVVGVFLAFAFATLITTAAPAQAACSDRAGPFVDWSGCDKSGAILDGQDLRWANFVGINLTGASLKGARMHDVDLRNAVLIGADLTGAVLVGSQAHYADFSYANLTGTDLTVVGFHYASLVGANLSSAILFRTTLAEADLSQANFTGASLSTATLTGNKFFGAYPVVLAPQPNITKSTEPGSSSTQVSYTGTATLGPDGDIGHYVVFSLPSGHRFPVGSTTVRQWLVDAGGSYVDFSDFVVTVTDDEAPVITPPPDQFVTIASGGTSATLDVTSLGSVADNVDTGLAISYAIGGSVITGPHAFPVGMTVVTMEARDSAGNTAQASFNVTVIVADGEVPVITVPADIAVFTDPGSATAVVDFTVTASDAEDGDLSGALVLSHAPGSAFPIGTTTVTADVTDSNGNAAPQASFAITVTDGEAPVITPPPDFFLHILAGATTSTLPVTSFGSVTDNVDTGLAITYTIGGSVITGSYAFPVGLTVVTMEASDSAGNTAQASFNVTVISGEAPVITVPADITVAAAPGSTTAVVDFTVTASDAEDGDLTGSLVLSHAPGSAFPIGTTTVTADVTDSNGNAAPQASFTVTVTGGAAPEITVPGDITVTADPGSSTAVVDFTVTASDAEDGDLTGSLVLSHAPGSAFPIGTTTVTADVTDSNGNAAPQASFTVTVTDGEAPVITVPADITVSVGPGETTVDVTFSVTASDNVDGDLSASVVLSHASGSAFPIGITTVTADVTDSNGNAAPQASFTVTVTGGAAPVITVPADIVVATAPGSTTAVVDFAVTASDAEDGDLTGAVVLSHAPGSAFAIGTTTVTADVTDSNGNAAPQASFTVTVTDGSMPGVPVAETQRQIAQFMSTRANQLLSHQPDLICHLSGRCTSGSAELAVTRDRLSFNLVSDPDWPVWFHLSGARVTDLSSRSDYVFGAAGSHRKVNDNTLLGLMLEIDHVSQSDGTSQIEGTGWMFGPYFVTRLPDQPLYFEGRLLAGMTHNNIRPNGTYTDQFDTRRILAQLKVAGQLDYETVILTPSLSGAYTRDTQMAYTDSFGNRIPEQGIELLQLEMGLELETETTIMGHPWLLGGGISGLYSRTSGSGSALNLIAGHDGGRARLDLSGSTEIRGGGQLKLEAFYDGIGASGYEAMGLALGFQWDF